MYKNSIKRCITVIFLYICIVSVFSGAFGFTNIHAEAREFHWYCIRNKEHKQLPLDPDMKFIQNYDGYYIDKKHGDNDPDKIVYLTFDAGYENGNIEKILDVLKEENVPGTFFILGNLLKKNKDLVSRMISDGHTVANHTMHHHNMVAMSSKAEFASELTALEKLYKETTGCEISKYFRPPEGSFSEDTLRYAKELGYKTIFWSIAYADWDNERQPTAGFAKEKILGNLHNGAVILLHPTSSTNASIMKELITEIRAQGYRFGTMEELTA